MIWAGPPIILRFFEWIYWGFKVQLATGNILTTY